MVLILIGSVDWLLVWGEVREQSIHVILLWKAKDKEYLTIYKDYERGRTMYHMMLQLWQCRAHDIQTTHLWIEIAYYNVF